MNIPSAIISFTALISYSILLIIILTRNVRSRVNLSFVYYLGTMIIWSFGALMVYVDARLIDTNFWFRLMLVGYIAMPIAFTAFIQNFLMKDWRIWLIGGILAYIVALISIITGSVAVSTNLSSGGQLQVILGPGKYVSAAIWFFFVSFSGYNLVHEYRHTNDLEFKNRIKWIFGVILLIFAGAATNVTPLQVYPVDIAFNTVAAIVIANALLRHHLLDIDVVLRRGMLYSIPTAIIGVSYYLILSLAWRAFPNTSNNQIFLISLAIAVMTAIIVQPLKDRAQLWVDRIFFREKYDGKLMLTRVSQTVTSVLDLDQLTHYILDEVTSTLHIGHAGFFLKREETGRYDLMAEKGMELHTNLSLAFTNPIVLYLLRHNQALSRYDINVQPQFRSMWGHEWDEINLIGAELFIPLKAKDELVGVFAVGPKLSEQLYSQDDQLTLITLANQTAVAIENARLYKAEQFRREELNALYALTSQLGATDEVGIVLDSTTRHAVESLHVTFAKVLTLEENGEFLCRTTFPMRTLSYPLSAGEYEYPAAREYYQKTILQDQSIILTQKDPSLSKTEIAALHLDHVSSLCIAPLRVGDEVVGLLILGEQRNLVRESFDNDKMRLVNAIAGQAASALQRAHLHEQMEESFVQTVLALANAADARDTYTSEHGQRLATLAEATCQELNLPDAQIKSIRWAAQLHDIGKIGIPDEILRKPGPLTDDEWSIMRRHPAIGSRIVAPVTKLVNVAPIIRAHHEKFDGSGYPFGLKGEEIPLGARIVSVVDAYGAMTDERPYCDAMTHAEAVAELQHCSGSQFDPKVVDAFLRVLDSGILRKSTILPATNEAHDATTRPIHAVNPVSSD